MVFFSSFVASCGAGFVSFGRRSKGESIQGTGTKRNGTGNREHTLLHDRDVLLSGGHLESKLVTESNIMRIW